MLELITGVVVDALKGIIVALLSPILNLVQSMLNLLQQQEQLEILPICLGCKS